LADRSLGKFADEWSREHARAGSVVRKAPFILFKNLNTETVDISALRERYDVRFQDYTSAFASEVPDIDEFDVGERYRADIVRERIESMTSNQQTLDPIYLRIVLDNLERVLTFTYRIWSQRNVRPAFIQVLFPQGEKVRTLKLPK